MRFLICRQVHWLINWSIYRLSGFLLNGKSLLFHNYTESGIYDGHVRLFRKVFDMDRYRFFKYDTTNLNLYLIEYRRKESSVVRSAFKYVFSKKKKKKWSGEKRCKDKMVLIIVFRDGMLVRTATGSRVMKAV